MKNYVVRGKIGPHAVHADRAGGEYAYADVDEPDNPAWRFEDVAEAQAAADHMARCECADVRIYDADTGAVVPTYAEALAQIEALARLDAARAPLTDAQVEGFAQTAMDDICKGTERPRNAIARAIRAALNAAGPEAPTTDPAARAESGPMRFGDDWAGVFLRGDYAGPMGMYLRQVLGDEDVRKRHPFSQRMLDGLAATLAGCDESGALSGLQQMRPFATCAVAGPRPDAQPNGAERGPADPCDEAPCADLACRWCWGNRNGA